MVVRPWGCHGFDVPFIAYSTKPAEVGACLVLSAPLMLRMLTKYFLSLAA